MTSIYFNILEKLLRKTNPKLFNTYKLEFKNCFGAVTGYVNGQIFVSCGKFGIALRLPPKTINELFKQEKVSHLKYFSKGHIKKEYAVIPKSIIHHRKHFKKLLNKSIKYAFR